MTSIEPDRSGSISETATLPLTISLKALPKERGSLYVEEAMAAEESAHALNQLRTHAQMLLQRGPPQV